jgi:hypothetical protein
MFSRNDGTSFMRHLFTALFCGLCAVVPPLLAALLLAPLTALEPQHDQP